MTEITITLARNQVYDALNLYEQLRYKENGKYAKRSWKNVIDRYEIYKNIGGASTLETFKESLADYLHSGYCGY